jgi:hypothetical protein
MGYKRGYKVVTQDLYSSTVMRKYAVKYKVSQWVFPKPRCGSLTVFSTFESAEEWCRYCSTKYKTPFLIFECRYRPARQINPLVYRPGLNLSFRFLPKDTDLASRVMLLQ